MFPSKTNILKDTAYTLFQEVFEESQPSDESIKILDCIIMNLYKCKQVFFEEQDKDKDRNDEGDD